MAIRHYQRLHHRCRIAATSRRTPRSRFGCVAVRRASAARTARIFAVSEEDLGSAR